MKKEILIAMGLGLSLGLIITLGISTANKALNEQKQKKSGGGPANIATTDLNNQQAKKLTISSPESFDLTDQSDVVISGIAWPEAVIALLAESQNLLTQADNEGIFTFKTELIKGFNEITVIASDANGTFLTQNLILTYSTSKIEP